MIYIILTILTFLIVGFIAYVYRWNIVNPNKNSSIKIHNIERTFIYHLPKKINIHPKLIIVYHGIGMKAFMMQIFTGHEFDLLADKYQNAIIVYPQGCNEKWNASRKPTPFPAKKQNIDDADFTEQIIFYFKKNYEIDNNEIYAVGFSNGGEMVLKLANLKPEIFKGFAVISANLPDEKDNDCINHQTPVSLIYFSGIKDPIIPFNGGSVILNGRNFDPVMSTELTLQHWLNSSSCSTIETSIIEFPDNKISGTATAIQKNYHSASTGKQISFVKIINGGHTIPNSNFRIPIKKIGNLNKDIDSPKMIWDFFMGLK